jgi:uncharacterized phage protein (TIGR01671 family)
MREIKFRAWDKHNKSLVAISSKRMRPINEVYSLSYQANEDGYTLDQFTGLHDMNGNEIYENDYLVWSDFEFGDERQVVYFLNGMFIAENDGGQQIELFEIVDNCEVIGNIHEEING